MHLEGHGRDQPQRQQLPAQATPTRRDYGTLEPPIGYGLLFTLGIYVFLYFALFALVHAVILLRTRRGRLLIGRWFWVSTIAIAAAAPVIYWAIRERRQIAYLGMGDSQVTFSTILVTLWFGTWWFAVLAWSLILVTIAFGTHHRWTRTVRTPPPDATGPVLPSLEFVAASWLLVPTLSLMTGEIFWAGFTARYASYSAPAAALLMASGLAWLGGRRRWSLAAGTLVVVLASVPIYASQREPYAKNQSDWADISVVLRERAAA